MPSTILEATRNLFGGAKTRVTVELNDATLEVYARQARANARTVEDECSQRLQRCSAYTASRPLYFNDSERHELERITGGHLIDSPSQVMARISNAVTLTVGDVEVALDERILSRLKPRAKSERRTIEEIVRREALRGLRAYAGLDPF